MTVLILHATVSTGTAHLDGKLILDLEQTRLDDVIQTWERLKTGYRATSWSHPELADHQDPVTTFQRRITGIR
jgi:hypothetical protein